MIFRRRGTQNDDLHPTRVHPRNVFDVGAGNDDLFKGERYQWRVRVSVLNAGGAVALYNFLSTFSGTHFVSPRTVQGEVRLVF